MTRDDLTALIRRVEAATCGDPLLDQLIWKTIAPKTWSDSPILDLFIHGYDEWGCNTADGYRHYSCGRVGPYTASLDAALTLVPPNKLWVRMDEWAFEPEDAPIKPSASVYLKSRTPDGEGVKGSATAATLALALTAAALRARLAMMGDDA
jgi:hypothetical protein